jgi:uncharacterized lipoprotein YehR (DUF1307 family)
MSKNTNGGRGDLALTDGSSKLDKNTKEAMKKIASRLSKDYEFALGHENRITKYTDKRLPEFVALGVTLGCVPDGGMWFEKYDNTRKLKYVFESKYQGRKGNAIERWGKNYILCKMLNPEVKYITFLSGEGCQEGEILHRFAISMRVLDPQNTIFYSNENGFTEEEISSIMCSYLSEGKK